VFDAEGRLIDEKIRASLAKYLVEFAEFIARIGVTVGGDR